MSTPEIHIQKEDLSQPELGRQTHELIQALDYKLEGIPEFKRGRHFSPTLRGRLTGFGQKFISLFDTGLRKYDVSGRDNFTTETAIPIPPNLEPAIGRRVKISDRESLGESSSTELVLETKFKCKFDENSRTAKITDYIGGKIHVLHNEREVENDREAIELATQLVRQISLKDEVRIDKLGDILIPNVPIPEWER